MRSLSKSLKKSYVVLVSFFSLIFLFFLFFLGKYMIIDSKNYLRNCMKFLNYEIGEDGFNKTLEIFTKDKVNLDFKAENPNLSILDVNIEFKNYKYIENDDEDLLSVAENNKVMNTHFYDYLILENFIKDADGNQLKVILIKNMKEEKLFFKKIVLFFFITMGLAIILISFSLKKFLNKIYIQLNNLKNLNTNITLENLNIIKPTNEFIEFDNIIDSYEEMLKRLEIENNKQIEFIHNASHELKTPLFIINSYLSLLKREDLKKDDFNTSLFCIQEEVNEMISLVEKLLFIAKTNKIKLATDDIELSEVVLKVISQLKSIYPNIKIIFKPSYANLISDEALIKILIKNIIENAIKYGNSKPIEISIFSYEKENIIEVKDNGIGMDKEDLNHLYDRFYRAKNAKNKNIIGHGLGMSVVKTIITLLNIDIEIHSEKNTGTTVKLIFKNK